MRRLRPVEASWPAIAAGAIAASVIARHAAPLLARLELPAPRPLALLGGGLLAALGACAAALRRRHVRRLLARRRAWQLVPADTLDPSVEEVVRFTAQLSRSRRRARGWLERPASAIRIRIHSAAGGSLAYELTAPAHAHSVLRSALGEYPELELREPNNGNDEAAGSGEAGAPETRGRPRLTWVRGRRGLRALRAELVLARPSHEPLADLGVDPDPLQAIAACYQDLDDARHERAEVIVDVLALTPPEARRARRAMARHARREDRRDHPPPPPRSEGGDPLGLGNLLAPGGGGRQDASASAARQDRVRALRAKAVGHEPLLRVQMLLRTQSTAAARAKGHMRAVLAGIDQFAGRNHWRVIGTTPPGTWLLGSDGPLRRRRFDVRARTGRWRAPRRNIVTARELAGLLKPPTARCQAPNVLRSAGHISPPPSALATFTGQPGLLPLGRVHDRRGERLVGVRLTDTFFSYMAGRSRYGKTELGLVQFIHLARSGHGGLFLDPHADAIAQLKSYLTDDALRDRVVEINLAGPLARERQPGWNPLAMHGHPPEAAEAKVEALVDAFASALGWDERNTRALALTTQATQALIDLSMKLPADTAPTLFQIPTLLGNPDWREQVLPHVSPPTRQFFTERFPRLPAEAITAVTNLIDRLRASTPIAALLGSCTSTYDIRAAMDHGQIVLACPGSGGTRDRLVANFLVYDLLHNAKARADAPAERRRSFFVYLDEVQTYDGASSGNLAALLEQTAKYGLRAFLFNQNPERLTSATLNAVTTNRSHLLTTTVNAKAATLLAREWGGEPSAQTVTRLARYTYLASVTLAGESTRPFLVHGIPAHELHADAHHPERLAALEAAIDATTARRTVSETLAALDTLDDRILTALPTTPTTGAPPGDPGVPEKTWEPTRT